MPQFFIDRPIFAWVVAIFIALLGIIAIPQLPIARYPEVAPPNVSIYVNYPGASPQNMSENVLSLIEREISGVKNLLYFESSADTSGWGTINVTFRPGTNPDMAQVDVQNKLRSVESRLPEVVRSNGLRIESTTTGFLEVICLYSPDGSLSSDLLGDYMVRNISDELKRLEGVGRLQVFVSELAMRIWVDPAKLVSYNISVADITNAIRGQNAQSTPGRVGGEPTVPGQMVTMTMAVQGQLETPLQFEEIVLRALPDGSKVTLSDVADVALGPQTYSFSSRLMGQPVAGAAVQLSPDANAVATATRVHERMEQLKRAFPPGMDYTVPYTTAPFVETSIKKVLQTFVEALFLVFIVMFIFLGNLRYTFIPAIVAPIALLGTFGVMYVLGFSINVLTMFGMVLAIGIIVDDAIVVVENVERIMRKDGLPPKEATKKAMKEITGAVIGITLVLSAVFIPMALSSGTVGAIYRQFALAMSVSILFSAVLALSLSPALCATLLKQHGDEQERTKGFFFWFHRSFERITISYTHGVNWLLARKKLAVLGFVVIMAAMAFLYMRLPTAFLPIEDQGAFLALVQLPADATMERTLNVMKKYEEYQMSRPSTKTVTVVRGFGFSGSGPNTGMSFVTLKDWGERPKGVTAQQEVLLTNQVFSTVTDGMVMTLMPPSVPQLGFSAGFAMRLQDRSAQGFDRLMSAQNQLLMLASQSPVLSHVYPEGLPPGVTVRVNIDRQKAETLGVSFPEINSTLSAALGSTYVNDFPNRGRMQQVIIQARPDARMHLDDVLKLYVRNQDGDMVPMSAVANLIAEPGPQQLLRYNGYPAVRLSGMAAPGRSSGDAMAEMERLVEQLPAGYTVEWTGQSFQERLSGAQVPMLMAMSLLVVFLVLAALYESWSIPFAVLLVVPLGLIGSLIAEHLRDLTNDVFFKVGMILIIGLAAKNAILIIEFARQLEQDGRSTFEAALEAARLRFRPILMTSLAFTFGVSPLLIAQDASSEIQHAIGTGVFGGMITGTLLAVFLVPAFYVIVRKLFGYKKLTRL